MSLIKELGFEISFLDTKKTTANIDKSFQVNSRPLKIPTLLLKKDIKNITKVEIKEALIFNRNLLIENFITPHRLRFPISRNILERYYN